MATAIAAWGNSDAIRVPRSILKLAGLKRGDAVTLSVNESGNIEIAPVRREHRRVAPAKGVTFESLTAGFGGDIPSADSYWPEATEPVGAEREAWSL